MHGLFNKTFRRNIFHSTSNVKKPGVASSDSTNTDLVISGPTNTDASSSDPVNSGPTNTDAASSYPTNTDAVCSDPVNSGSIISDTASSNPVSSDAENINTVNPDAEDPNAVNPDAEDPNTVNPCAKNSNITQKTDTPTTVIPIVVKLPIWQKLAYSVGLVLSSMCATMWASYILIYYNLVQNFNDTFASGLVLFGQVSVAVITPIVGYLADKGRRHCPYGSLKTWHLVGTILIGIAFPFMFMNCFNCEKASQQNRFGYYAFFNMVFAIGFCATQITHVALIPNLTHVAPEKVELDSFRYAAIVLSSIFVYCLMWIFLERLHRSTLILDTQDSITFQEVSLIIIGLGLFFSLIFHIFVKEKKEPFEKDDKSQLNWTEWFKEPQLYMVAFLYVPTKLYYYLTMLYLPLYIEQTLQLDKNMIAIIPLVVLITSFISSCFLKYMSITLGNKLSFLIGCFLGFAACFWVLFGHDNEIRFSEIYFIAIFMGFARSVLFILSLAMASDLIGISTSSGAFVFSFMDFTNRIANGVAVVVISNADPCKKEECKNYYWYYKNVMSYGCGACILWAVIALAILWTEDIGHRPHRLQQRSYHSDISTLEAEITDAP